jgi:hypothetical protein
MDEIIACFTLSNNHLNQDMNQTDKKNITIIQIIIKHIFMNVLPAFDVLLPFTEFLYHERFDLLN